MSISTSTAADAASLESVGIAAEDVVGWIPLQPPHRQRQRTDEEEEAKNAGRGYRDAFLDSYIACRLLQWSAGFSELVILT